MDGRKTKRSKYAECVGKRYGRLVVIGLGGDFHDKYPPAAWCLCRCDCGVESVIRVTSIIRGHAKSCGCLKREQKAIKRVYSCNEKWYGRLHDLIGKCHSKKHKSYHAYGAKGVTVCDEWRNDPRQFLVDMGDIPSAKHRIVRIDNSIGYRKDNCKWAIVTANGNRRVEQGKVLRKKLADDEIIGKKYGMLTVSSIEREKDGNGRTVRYCNCTCDCGSSRRALFYHLKKGITKQCGNNNCGHRRDFPRMEDKDQDAIKKMRAIRSNMITRCTNKNCPAYPKYGGAGISVCDEWRQSFDTFLSDMGPRPSRNHQIDRIDGSKGYCKDNCRWATPSEQSRNRSSNRLIEWNGRSMCATDWEIELGLRPGSILNRLHRGWSVSAAMTDPYDVHVAYRNRSGAA